MGRPLTIACHINKTLKTISITVITARSYNRQVITDE